MCSPPGSSVLQARILEWVAMPSSRGSSDPGIELTSSVSLALQVGSSLLIYREAWSIHTVWLFGFKKERNFLVFQWLGLCVLTAKDLGWILGQETKILCSAWCSQKKRKKKKGGNSDTHYNTGVGKWRNCPVSFYVLLASLRTKLTWDRLTGDKSNKSLLTHIYMGDTQEN